ncbi:sensor histidine kinase [Robertmurraya kyonggiensis]|nr:HAMP domain-containing sensor histidine kinase [Robertmurraya kyonggiensis]
MKEMKEQLTAHLVGVTSLWSSTIQTEDVEKVIETKDNQNPHYQNISDQLSLINEKNSNVQHGYILNIDINDGGVTPLVTSKSCEELGMRVFSSFDVPDVFKEVAEKTIETKQITHTDVYKAEGTSWISAFSPVLNQDGEVIALLVISTKATSIDSFQKEIVLSLCAIFLIITILVYFIFKKLLTRLLDPVNEIISGINEVSNGNFQVKLQVVDETDLGKLMTRFNYMTEQLSLLFERLTITSRHLGDGGHHFRQSTKFEDAIDEMENIIQKTKILKELQRAEKMNAIGQLAASVAHEIRNPMTVVKGFLQIFKTKKELSDEEQAYVKLMIDEMNRAETIINDYLSLAKPDMESMERVDGVSLANKAMDLMNSFAMMSKNIQLETKIEEQVFVNGNRSELNQVLINILKNGIEAMKDGGTLSLRVYQDGSFGVFEIKDSGIGMSQGELERLGTAFYSLKEKGTGMGLMVCYQIIERMKGKIDVVSEKGKGTTFTISVPLDESQE